VNHPRSPPPRPDTTDDGSEDYPRANTWDGKEQKPTFDVDFVGQKLGKPHLMRFGSASLYN
jgi:selenium-binding protein 1